MLVQTRTRPEMTGEPMVLLPRRADHLRLRSAEPGWSGRTTARWSGAPISGETALRVASRPKQGQSAAGEVEAGTRIESGARRGSGGGMVHSI